MSLAELHAPGKGSHAAAPQPGASAPGTSAGAPAAPPTSATKQANQPLTAPSAPAAPNSKARPSTQPPAWPAGQQPRGAAPAAAKPQQPPVEASSASQPLFEQREWDWDKVRTHFPLLPHSSRHRGRELQHCQSFRVLSSRQDSAG